MKLHPQYGPVAPEIGWVPPPSFLLRRDRILRAMAGRAPSRVLEVGCGAGALITDLATRGYQCSALETSPRALDVARKLASGAGVAVEVRETPVKEWEAGFPMVMAFEVLEHIEDDAAALREWAAWLEPGGVLLLSVPAHASKWGAGDVWAGHFRRYEKDGLVTLLERSGFRVERLESWGFPLANLTQPVANFLYRRKLRARADRLSQAEATAESGVERETHVKFAGLLVNPVSVIVMRLMLFIQHLFVGRDIGVGHLVVARKT